MKTTRIKNLTLSVIGVIAMASVVPTFAATPTKDEKGGFQKGKEVVVDVAKKTADKSVEVYDVSKKAVVNTTNKTVKAVKDFFK